MSDEGRVTHWIQEVKKGDSDAASALWERYFERLVRLARSKLDGMPCRIADEEEVALGAFHSFCKAAASGRSAGSGRARSNVTREVAGALAGAN